MFMKFLKTEEGFTLVELMVVVAIIGVLSAVAIPNFKKYQAKSKTSEAKLQLASIYSAEVSLQTDFDSFGTCLGYAGYVSPNGAFVGDGKTASGNNYYALGFPSDDAVLPGDDSDATSTGNSIVFANGGEECTNGKDYAVVAVKSVGGKTAGTGDDGVTTVLGEGGVSKDGGEFRAVAAGWISVDSDEVDKWTIDQDKKLQHAAIGY
jgi:type IV pilus assembly protein PilA